MKSAILFWFGAIGSALSILGAVDPLLELSKWAKWIISEWSNVITEITQWIAKTVSIELNYLAVQALLPLVFFISIFVSAKVSSISIVDDPLHALYSSKIVAVAAVFVTFFLLTVSNFFKAVLVFIMAISIVKAMGGENAGDIRSSSEEIFIGSVIAWGVYLAIVFVIVFLAKANRPLLTKRLLGTLMGVVALIGLASLPEIGLDKAIFSAPS